MKNIRPQFPYIMQDLTCYLDNAATAHKPQCMIDAMSNFYAFKYATVHRGLYPDAEATTEAYENCRAAAADFLGAPSSQSIIFTKGTTESLNALASVLSSKIIPGNTILLTQAEHHANLLPWQRLAQESKAKLCFIPIDQKTYMLQDPLSYLSEETKIVSVSMSSNVLGNIWAPGQLHAFIHKAKELGCIVILDAAQAAAHEKICIKTLMPDALVASGHKLYGPTGVGILYINKELARELPPYHVGGSMVGNVTFEHATYAPAPTRFEAGTPPIASVIGLQESLNFLQRDINFEALAKHETTLIDLAESLLSDIAGISFATAANKQHRHVLSFAIQGIHAHDIAGLLGAENIAVRAGNHCAQPLINTLGFESLLRISVGCYNTEEEIRTACDAIKKHVKTMRSLFERVKND